jgi:uncharacterized surface anchored protein
VVVQTQTLPGYLPAPATPVPGLVIGQTTEIDLTNPTGGTILVRKEDEFGNRLASACFQAYADAGGGTRGDYVTASCDYFDDANDGTTALIGLRTGDYVVVEFQTPVGYLTAPDQPVPGVVAGQTTEATVIDVLGGTVVIHATTTAGVPLPGACFQVWTDAGDGTPDTAVAGSCDYFGESNDGATSIQGLSTGDYVVVEFQIPEGYQQAPNQQVHVDSGTSTEVDAVHNAA